MKRITLLATCLALLGAFLAVTVASAAAAEPALYECAKTAKNSEKKYTGKYTEKKCAKEATAKEIEEGKTNKYELKEGIAKAKAFKGKSKGANLEVEGIGGITCTSSTDTGKFNSPKSAEKIVVTFKGCAFLGKKCSSTGQLAGTIVTDPLKGEVGYLSGKGTKTPKVGALISAETGEALAAFDCEADHFGVIGSVIGEVTPVNEFTKKATFTFKQASKIGVQEFEHFEGEAAEHVLRTHLCAEEGCNPFEQSGPGGRSSQEIKSEQTGEELELKA